MAGSLQTNVRFSTEYWMRLAVIAMFGWTTTAEPLFAQTPPAPDPAQQAPGAAGTPAPADQAADVYSMSDLEYLLGPIALYPDPLLALILPASTHPDQIIEAARWLENNAAAAARNDFTEVDAKPWDPSVQALTRFPDTIKMLADHPDWTESLGWAFSVQDADVAAVIQMLRAKAESAGNLKIDARAGRDDAGRRRLPGHLHRADQPRADLCSAVRFLRRVRHRRHRGIGVRHRRSGWLGLEQSMGLEQPELESGVDPSAGPRLASSGPAHQAASRRVASGWPGSPPRRSSGSARHTSSGPTSRSSRYRRAA